MKKKKANLPRNEVSCFQTLSFFYPHPPTNQTIHSVRRWQRALRRNLLAKTAPPHISDTTPNNPQTSAKLHNKHFNSLVSPKTNLNLRTKLLSGWVQLTIADLTFPNFFFPRYTDAAASAKPQITYLV